MTVQLAPQVVNGQQYLRQASLIVSGAALQTDLSQLRFTFRVQQSNLPTPNSAIIRVYNLAENTAQLIQNEFTAVSLSAGYSGSYGTIFAGTIKQIRRGREDNMNTYLDIFAADADQTLNFAVVNTSLAAGSTEQDRLNAIVTAIKAAGGQVGYIPPLSQEKAPRGVVLYGMARDLLRELCLSGGYTFSMNGNRLDLTPLSGYIPSEAVVVNSQTGMIGIPEVTEDGVKVTTLLNPTLAVGCKLKINQADIQALALPLSPFVNSYPKASADGIYAIFVIDYRGDTRGNEWYSDIICLATDPTAKGLAPGLVTRGPP